MSDGATLLATATALMRGQLGGNSDETSTIFDGVHILGLAWTDGVNDIISWFAQPSAAVAVRLDYSRRCQLERRPPRSVEQESLDIFATLRWQHASVERA